MDSACSCVLLAVVHPGLAEGIRCLLGTASDMVVIVADESSLHESARRLRPQVAVVDLELARGDVARLLRRVRLECEGLKVIFLSVHDDRAIRKAVLEAGAAGLVSRSKIATDLLPAVCAVLEGKGFGHETEGRR